MVREEKTSAALNTSSPPPASATSTARPPLSTSTQQDEEQLLDLCSRPALSPFVGLGHRRPAPLRVAGPPLHLHHLRERERGFGLSTSGCRCRFPPPQSQRHSGRSVNRGFATTTAAFVLLSLPLPSPLREDEQRWQHWLERRPTQCRLEATPSLCIGATQLSLLLVPRLRSSPSASSTRRGTVGKRMKKM